MMINLSDEQVALIRDMLQATLWKADDKLKDRLFDLDRALNKPKTKLIYKLVWHPVGDEDMKTISKYRDKGWWLQSHSLYRSPDGELIISFMFARQCDCQNCHNCPH